MNSNLISIITGLKRYPKFNPDKKKKIIENRFKETVEYAKKNSPYIAELYKDLGDDYKITDIPVVTKKMMMSNYDTYATDREISMKSVLNYMADKNNRKIPYLGKYEVGTTSGSTGLPAIMIFDELASNADAAISFIRNKYSIFPMANICIDDGFGVDNSALDQNTEKYPFIKYFAKIIDSGLPYDELARQLNEYKPKLLLGYTGVMLILADLADEGKLHIKPKQIVVSGEYTSETAYNRLKSAFGCNVSTVYACTEAGVMTRMCKHGHLHINTDWYILEAVDKDNNPVPNGTCSDKTLVTAFSRRAMPIIRYELTDKITIHDEPCDCGSPDPWIEVEGRTNDFLNFADENGKVCKIVPMVIFDLIDVECGEKIKNYQLIVQEDNTVLCRLISMVDEEREQVFSLIKNVTENYLNKFNIHINMVLVDEKPKLDERTGKFKQIFQDDRSLDGTSGRIMNFNK